MKYEVLSTPDGNYTLKITGEREFYLNSRYAPVKEAERFAKEHYSTDVESFLLYGFGLGYHIREFLKLMNDNQKLHVIELNTQVFQIATKLQVNSDIIEDKRLNLHIGGSLKEVSDVFYKLLNGSRTKLVIHNPSLQCIEKEFDEFKFILENWRIRENSFERARDLINWNLEQNRRYLRENAGIFFNRHTGKPIIIISAGPSLDKNIMLLEELCGKVVMIAVGRALKPLIKRGIKPNYFVVTDPQVLVREQIRGLEDLDIPGLFLITSNHDAVRDYKGPKYAVCQEEEYLSDSEKGFLVETGGSVATTALDIAIKMGGDPIVFVGQDLAFSDGRHHAEGTQYSEKENPNIEQSYGMLSTRGWYGGEVPTSMSFLSFKKWMEDRIRREANTLFINATEGGAYINGCRHMRLRDFMDKYVK